METMLPEALQQRWDTGSITHAYMLTGRAPDALMRCAYGFAQKLLGISSQVTEHPDLHVYKPEGTLLLHTIASLRQLMDEAALAPYMAPWKVFIITEAERMLPTSANALLKTLEEPPPRTILMLNTGYPQRILPTVRSRCVCVEVESRADTAAAPFQETLLAVLAGGAPVSALEKYAEEIEKNPLLQEKLCICILDWYRDGCLLAEGGNVSLLHFPGCAAPRRAVSWPQVLAAVQGLKGGLERSMKLLFSLEVCLARIAAS